MTDLADGESTEMKGSGANPYILKNTGGVYSCSCPAWRNQSTPIEQRTCKHLRKLRGDEAELARLGGALPGKPVKSKSKTTDSATGDAAEEPESTAPPILLAHSWDNLTDLSDWWISEKLDGVRAYWDGSQFISRQGNLYHAPAWFVENLPDTPLDGELWIDRKKFQRTVGIVRRQDKSDHWKEVKFQVFDAPALQTTFEERIAYLADYFSRFKPAYAAQHDQWKCQGLDHLRSELSRIEALGGEGLMLRQPASKYEVGRSTTLLKIKTFHDAEAIVVGHQPGAGKHAGKLGALAVKLPDGTPFAVGSGFTDRERAAPPPIGSTITFRYQELSDGGVPRFPTYVGLRTDLAPVEIPSAAPRVEPPSVTVSISSPSSGSGTGQRRFEFQEGGSGKFWKIQQIGNQVTTTWGKLGTAGQSKTKAFADDAGAEKEAASLVTEKTKKGYVEVEAD